MSQIGGAIAKGSTSSPAALLIIEHPRNTGFPEISWHFVTAPITQPSRDSPVLWTVWEIRKSFSGTVYWHVSYTTLPEVSEQQDRRLNTGDSRMSLFCILKEQNKCHSSTLADEGFLKS